MLRVFFWLTVAGVFLATSFGASPTGKNVSSPVKQVSPFKCLLLLIIILLRLEYLLMIRDIIRTPFRHVSFDLLKASVSTSGNQPKYFFGCCNLVA